MTIHKKERDETCVLLRVVGVQGIFHLRIALLSSYLETLLLISKVCVSWLVVMRVQPVPRGASEAPDARAA